MEALAMPVAEEAVETAAWGETPPPKWEEEDLDLLAFELWQRASCAELEVEPDWLEAEIWCHASWL